MDSNSERWERIQTSAGPAEIAAISRDAVNIHGLTRGKLKQRRTFMATVERSQAGQDHEVWTIHGSMMLGYNPPLPAELSAELVAVGADWARNHPKAFDEWARVELEEDIDTLREALRCMNAEVMEDIDLFGEVAIGSAAETPELLRIMRSGARVLREFRNRIDAIDQTIADYQKRGRTVQ